MTAADKQFAKQSEAARVQVDKLFPIELKDRDNNKDSCFDVYRANSDGSPSLIFAVYPAYETQIRLISQQEDGSYNSRNITPADFEHLSLRCDIATVTLDASGRQAVGIGLENASDHEANYIFDWNGSALRSIGPTKLFRGKLGTVLQDAFFDNLVDDGTLALVSTDALIPDVLIDQKIYEWENGSYVEKAHSIESLHLTVGRSGSATETEDFEPVNGVHGPYTIQIGNGDVHGKDRVSDLRVTINGKVAIPLGMVSQKMGTYQVGIPNVKPTGNSLTIELIGSPGSDASIYITEPPSPN